MKKRLNIIGIVCAIIAIILVLYIILSGKFNLNKFKNNNEENNVSTQLPTVGSKEKLESLIEKYSDKYYMNKSNMLGSTDSIVNSTEASGNEHSNTNVQVEGVDEADIVKTDGNYIYSISNNKLVITEAYPVENMKVVTTLFDNEKLNVIEMMLDSKYLTVICSEGNYGTYGSMDVLVTSYDTTTSTKIYVYDISNKNDIKQVKELSIDGTYLTSRKIDNTVYLLTNKYIVNNQNQDIRPAYKVDGQSKVIDYDKIYYFPDTTCSNYTMIGALDLANLSNEVKVTSYLSSSQNVYMSTDNLYITAYKWQDIYKSNGVTSSDVSSNYSPITSIYKFNLKNDNVNFVSKAELNGSTLNQFSMDEYNGYFKVALTNNTDNSLYILDKDMKTVGQITGIAKGEKIYSTRFINDRAYIVTFKTIDPLFVIDTKDPTNPKILGELKIPGYSSYLHPYDENHIIGIGQDTAEVYDKDKNGKIINTRYVINGMKMAMFDVTDVNNPKEEHSIKIGNRNTYSEILYNHKALLFSKEKNLLAIPIDIYGSEISIQTSMLRSEDNIIPNTSNRFQGLVVYNVDLEKGFTEKGKITHYDVDESKTNKYSYNYLNNIKRGIFINDILYTVSDSKIKANNLDNLNEIKNISLEK